ncbi:hypothetical protein DPSP01_001219 [Paraphaeosphaeria sporulosa]
MDSYPSVLVGNASRAKKTFAHVRAKTCKRQNKQDRDYSDGIDQNQKDQLKSRVGCYGCGNVQDNLFVPTDAIGGAANLEQEYAGRQYTVAPSDPGFVTHTSGSMNQNPLAQNPQDTYHFGSQHCMSTSSIWDERNMKYGYTPHRHTASFAQYHTRPCYAPRLAAEQYPADKYRDDEWQQEMIQSDQQREDEE